MLQLFVFCRTKLSKSMDNNPESLYLRPQEFYDALNIRVLLEKRASDVNLEDQTVIFDDGDEIYYDQLMIATGTIFFCNHFKFTF